MGDWSCGLPRDVLASILQRLILRDRIRFGAVCVSWRFFVAEVGFPPQLPWLLFRRTQADMLNETCNFYSLSDKTEYTVHLPGVQWSRCLESSNGWLIFLNHSYEMSFLNPLTRAQIHLPSLKTVYTAKEYSKLKSWGICHVKADVFWTSASSYTVVILPEGFPKLAFARAGDEAWTVVETPHGLLFVDLVFHKGMFHILSKLGGRVEALDLTGPDPKFIPVVGDCRDPANEPVTRIAHLVESGGDLFQLVESSFRYDFTLQIELNRFELFKLDPTGPKWIVAQTLGNHALFLGRHLSVSIPAHDFPGLKGDCIYFVDVSKKWDSPNLRVFDLEDGSVKAFHPHDSHLTCPIRTWFVPNMLRRDIQRISPKE